VQDEPHDVREDKRVHVEGQQCAKRPVEVEPPYAAQHECPGLREVKQVDEGRRIGQVLDHQDVRLEGLRQARPVGGKPLLRLPPVELDIPLVPEPVALLDGDGAKTGTVPLAEHGEEGGGDPLGPGGRNDEEPVPLPQDLFDDVELAGVETDGVEGEPRPQVRENLYDHLGAGETLQEAPLEGDDPVPGFEMEDRLGRKIRPGGDARQLEERVEERFPEQEGKESRRTTFESDRPSTTTSRPTGNIRTPDIPRDAAWSRSCPQTRLFPPSESHFSASTRGTEPSPMSNGSRPYGSG